MSNIDIYEIGELTYKFEGRYAFRQMHAQFLYELCQLKPGETSRDCTVIQNNYYAWEGQTGADVVMDSVLHNLVFSYKGNIFAISVTVGVGYTAWQLQAGQNSFLVPVWLAEFNTPSGSSTLISPSRTLA